MKETSAGAVIFRIEKQQRLYLLLHYGPEGHWDFAKGHIEGKETEEQTMRREAAEETGITDVKVIPGFRHVISYFYQREGKHTAKDVIYLLAETKTAQVTISWEHSGFAWLPFEDALKKITYANSKIVLKKAAAFLDSHRAQQ